MFSKRNPDPATLSDEGLQQVLDGMAQRQRRMDKLWTGLFFVSIAIGISLGGPLGYALGAAIGASSSGGMTGALIFGALGMGCAVETSEGVSNKIHRDREWKAKSFKNEIQHRAKLRAEEEERMKTPLDSRACEAFMSALDRGTKEAMPVNRPLRLKKRTTDFSPTRRLLN